MVIAIVGPEFLTKRCKTVIRRENPEIEVLELSYSHYKEAPDLVAENQHKVDGVIFTGKTPFKVTESKVAQTVPWTYFKREVETLYRALLEANAVLGRDLKRISFDTYERDMIIAAYLDIGIREEQLDIYIAEQRLLDEYYHDYLMKFHMDNYQYNRASCCITGFTEIYNALREKNIPCARTTAPQNIILMAYHRIEQAYILEQRHDNQIVVIDVKVDLPNTYIPNESQQYLQVRNRNKIAEQLHLFALRINASVIEVSSDRFLLFATHKSLKMETNDFYDLYLFDLLRDITIKKVSVGIGYGETVVAAQVNAYNGMLEAEKAGNNSAIIVYDKDKRSAPIKLSKTNHQGQGGEDIQEDYIYQISRKTGLSTASLWKVYRGVKYLKDKEITSQRLATVCEMSKRNMDRIILKLEQGGICDIVEERVEGKAGRPTRILRFKGF